MELKLTVVLPNTDWLRKNPDRLIIVVVFVFLFLLKGELSVNIGREHNIHLLEHNMLLIPQHEENRVEGIVSAECLLLFWNKQITACDKMYFESISHVKMENGNNCILPIRKPLLHILRQLLFIWIQDCYVGICISLSSRKSFLH